MLHVTVWATSSISSCARGAERACSARVEVAGLCNVSRVAVEPQVGTKRLELRCDRPSSLPFPLDVGPLLELGRPGELPRWVQAEPGRQTVFGEL